MEKIYTILALIMSYLLYLSLRVLDGLLIAFNYSISLFRRVMTSSRKVKIIIISIFVFFILLFSISSNNDNKKVNHNKYNAFIENCIKENKVPTYEFSKKDQKGRVVAIYCNKKDDGLQIPKNKDLNNDDEIVSLSGLPSATGLVGSQF